MGVYRKYVHITCSMPLKGHGNDFVQIIFFLYIIYNDLGMYF